VEVKYLRASVWGALREHETASFRSAGLLPVVINDVYIPNMFRPERIQIWYGGSGSGKSDGKGTELLLKCLLNDYCRVMFVRKVQDTIRLSQFQLFKDLIKRFQLEEFFHIQNVEMRITCKQNGNMLFARGLDDVDKIKSIADVTDIWIEEPIDKKGSISSSDFTELNRRLRCLKATNHIHLTFNPISKDSWINDYFFKSNEYAAFTLRTTYLDNHFSPPESTRQFEILKLKKPEEYKVYALGEWGSLKQGLIYPEYSIITEFPEDCRHTGYGWDWGFYPDPWAMVKCGTKDGWLYMHEMFYENNHTSATRSKAMLSIGLPKSLKIIADRNPEAIAEMATEGWHNFVPAEKGPGSVKAGIDVMKGYKLAITHTSKNLKTELDNYSWAVDRRTGDPTGDPIDDHNHILDAARYFIMSDKRVFTRIIS
jgi:phage terminase large subunit